MARPRIDSEATPAKERIYGALWGLIQEEPFECISISQITERANCNRGTFYYYYTDIYDLLDKMVERSFPDSIPRTIIKTMFDRGGKRNSLDNLAQVVDSEQNGIDTLCVLLNSSATEYVRKRVTAIAMQTWHDALKVDVSTANQEPRILFEFIIHGMMGVMAYRAQTGLTISVREISNALSPEIPKAILKNLHRHGVL